MSIWLEIIILIAYIIFVILTFSYVTFFRNKRIKKITNSEEFYVINKRLVIRGILAIINVALIVGAAGIIFTVSNALYLIVDLFLTYLIIAVLFVVMQIGTALELFVYSKQKLFLLINSKLFEFEFDRIHFEKAKSKTVMYYKDEIVITTHQKLYLNKIRNNK